MIGDMKNRARAALVVLACLFALTGCVKVDADLKVNSNESVSGSMKIGVDKQLMESSGTSLDKVRQQVESGIKQTTTEGVECTAFEDDKYVGSDCKFNQVPFSKMGSSTGDGVGFRKDGDKFVVTVKALDLAKTPQTGTPPAVNFKITMPGKITAHDDGASVSGRTATYDSLDKLGNVSLTSEASSGFPLWAIILIIVVLLAAAGAVVFFVMRGRKSRGQQYPPGQDPQGQWGPQYAGQPGQPGQPGQQGMQYRQPGQPMQYGQPGQPMQYGQPAPGQYPGQPPQGPQGPQEGQPGQWGQPGPQQRPPQGPPQGPPPQQGGGGQSPQQGWNQPPGQGGQQGGWGQPPQGNGGQGPEQS
ncbi:MAG: hypothetical protein QOH50_914 [Kribbellaceae bacterium]|jgi:hypothetical protein|nr:hypothetical protein [Kribbellaceae bacterium]